MLLTLEGIVSAAEVSRLREILATAKLESGLVTARGSAARVKNNLELVEEDPAFEEALGIVTGALDRNAVFQAATYPSRMTMPRFSRYDVGMRYGDHLDSPLMGREERIRLDVSVTIFLSSPDEYEGGELVIDTGYGIQRCKRNAGACVIYPAGTLHRVEEVTRGARLVAVLWIQSLVADPERRKLLFDLAGAIEYLDRFSQPGPQIETLRRCHANLLRMWAQP